MPDDDFTEHDKIQAALTYLGRVRSMMPSPQALKDIEQQEAELHARLNQLPTNTTRHTT